MKRINGKELLIAYLIRAAIAVVLYIYVKVRGLLDVDTVGLFAGLVRVSIYLLIPSIFAYFVNLFYMKRKKYGSTYNVTKTAEGSSHPLGCGEEFGGFCLAKNTS